MFCLLPLLIYNLLNMFYEIFLLRLKFLTNGIRATSCLIRWDVNIFIWFNWYIGINDASLGLILFCGVIYILFFGIEAFSRCLFISLFHRCLYFKGSRLHKPYCGSYGLRLISPNLCGHYLTNLDIYSIFLWISILFF